MDLVWVYRICKVISGLHKNQITYSQPDTHTHSLYIINSNESNRIELSFFSLSLYIFCESKQKFIPNGNKPL